MKKPFIGDTPIIVTDLNKHRVADASYFHALQLEKTISICPSLRRPPEKMNIIFGEGIEIVMKAKVIKPANSSLAVSLLIARKKDGSLNFCVENRVFNCDIMAEKYPIITSEEVLHELKYVTVFS